MKRISLVFSVLTLASVVHARPELITDVAAIEAPDPTLESFGEVAGIDGDWAIIRASRSGNSTPGVSHHELALLYRRVNGVWKFERQLVDYASPDDMFFPPQIDMKNGLAAVAFGPLRVFRRSGNQWNEVTHPFTAPAGTANGINGRGIAWRGSTLIVGVGNNDCGGGTNWGALVATLRSDNTWTTPRRLEGGDVCEEEPTMLSASGNTIAIASDDGNYLSDEGQIRFYKESTGGWQLAFSDPVGGVAVVRGAEIFHPGISGYTRVKRNDASLATIDQLRTPHAFQETPVRRD